MKIKLHFEKTLVIVLFLIPYLFFSQKDCSTAMAACGNMNITYTPSGPGNYDDVSNGCLYVENNSAWYKFTIATSGTLTFMITPTGAVDYDWAVYGPNKTCSNRGAPIRCNYALPAGIYTTGLNMTNTNTSSSPTGSPYCRYMDVIAGETYYLFIDNYSPTVYTFNLTWGGSATLQDPFNNPAISPNPFNQPGVAGANPNGPREIYVCSSPVSFNFTSLTPGILNGNQNFVVTYHSSANNALTGNAPLPSPTNVTTGTTYYYSINYQDPSNPNNPINSCRKTGSFIFINKAINLTITPSSTTICPNGTVTLTSNQSSGNTWSNGATTQSTTVNAAGTYTLTNNTACNNTTNITINAQADPNLQISGNLSICQGTSTALTATATGTGNTYSWNTGATTPTINVSTAGTYTSTVTVPSGCKFTKSVTVNIAPAPTAQNSVLTVCSSSTTAVFDLTSAQPQISTTAGATFTYYQNLADAQAQNTNNITSPNTYTSGNVTLYVLVKVGNCSTIVQLQLVLASKPTPTITASAQNICANSTITLTSSLPTGNTWSTGATTPTITINSAGTYTVTNSNGGCTSDVVSITITQTPDPNLQITGNLSFCQGSSTNLTATAAGTGNTYSWNTGATTATLNVTTAGTYTATVTTATGCTFTKTAIVSIAAAPTVQNATLSACSNATTAVFNLISAQPQISTSTGVTFTYYQNLADAQAQNTNNITSPNTYTSGNAIIHVLVKQGTCSAIAQLQLIVNAKPAPTITTSGQNICANSSVTLTSSLPTGNTWSNGATTQSITVTAAGTYTLTNSNGTCTSDVVSTTITQTPDPNLQITGNLSFCQGSSTNLTATAAGTGNTYSWNTGATTATLNVTTAGTYTATVTTASGCIFTKSVTVTQMPSPTAQNANLSMCSSTTTATFNLTSAQPQISTTTGVTFTYYQNLADAQAQNSNNITTTNAYSSASTIIYVVVKSGQCSKIVELQLIVNPKPVPTITASAAAICDNSSVTLTSNYPNGNTWSTGATTSSITVTTAGTYTLTVNDGTCTSNPVSLNMVANPNPNIQISGNLTFCEGNSTVLTASASGSGNTFSWSNGTNNASTTISAPGNYTVTVTTSGGCQYQKTITVIMDPKIVISIANPQTITCTTSQVTLNAIASTYLPGSTFLWTATAGGNIVSGGTTLTPIVNSGGTYTLKITSPTPQGCSAQSSATVISDKASPVLSITAPALKICKGESVVLTANGAATYTWNNGLTGNGSIQTVSPTTTTTYSITGVGANGCSSTTPATITITVVPAITSTLSDIEFCKGETGTLSAGNDPTYTYVWSNGATTPSINVTTAGTYSVTIKNGTCSKVFSATVKYTTVPTIKEVKYENNSLTIFANYSGNIPLEYSIDGGVIWQLSNVFQNVFRNTLYNIKVKTRSSNCYGETDYYTTFIPNTISPNFDGKNDKIDFTKIIGFEKFEGTIFDKYGTVVFRPSTKTPVWDGTYLGRPLPTDTYWYKLSWIDSVTKKPIESSGWIVVKNRD